MAEPAVLGMGARVGTGVRKTPLSFFLQKATTVSLKGAESGSSVLVIDAPVDPLLVYRFGSLSFFTECRATVRPLLLDATPDSEALAAALATCEREAEAGDADARYQLSLFHLGLAGEWQPDLAIPMMRDAAAAGVSEAQYWLAWQYEAGPLLDHDEGVALGWYQRAANADHRLAIPHLAQAYEAGELGLPRDTLRATQYRARQSRCERQPDAGT